MSLPLVSILMPAYNVDDCIGAAILSCQRQTYLDWELCIVDDDSQDTTYDIALDYSLKDNRIRVIHQYHQGSAAAKNYALSMANGDIIFRQDAYALQDPMRLEQQVNELLLKDIEVVSCKAYWLTAKGTLLKGVDNKIISSSIAAWESLYKSIGGFSVTKKNFDQHWNNRVIKSGARWGLMDEPLYIQRYFVT